MATELQKQNSSALTFAKQPEEFLTQLWSFIETLQDAYRSKLSAAEQILWRDSLCNSPDQFSMEEITAALRDLIANPPLQRIESGDGWISQPYMGMPKLPDFIQRMVSRREAIAAKAVSDNVENAPDPACERCGGTGWRPVIDRPNRVAKCHCWAERPKLPERPQLPPAEEDRKTIRDVLKSVAEKAGVNLESANRMPEAKPEPVSAVLQSPKLQEERRDQMLRDLKAKGTIQ